MGFWFIPFIGVSILVLGVLSMVVVEYQDQKSRRFDSFKSLRCPELEKGLKCEFGTCVRFTLKKEIAQVKVSLSILMVVYKSL